MSTAAIIEELRRRAIRPPTVEELLTELRYFALTTASPLQRACCRIIDGRPLGDLASDPHVIAAVGGVDAIARIPATRCSHIALLSGIRSAKSMLAACVAISATQTCDISRLGPGETARYSVVSTRLDLADVILQHIVGNVRERPDLRRLLVEEPTADTVTLRHPSGRPVEIKVVAGAKAGTTLVARWSAGAAFDEAPRMVGQEDGVVNLDDMHSAVFGRLLPGAQVIDIGSVWAPRGPIYQMVTESFGRPTRSLVVIKAPAHHMNPVTWTPEAVEYLRVNRPDVHRTDILCEFLDPEESLLSAVDLEKCLRRRPDGSPDTDVIAREYGHQYFAMMDPATRGNAWTLAIGTRRRVGDRVRLSIVLARQWIGSKAVPLSPRAVLGEISEICQAYGLRSVASDLWSGDANRDIAEQFGLSLTLFTSDEKKKLNRYSSFATRVAMGDVDLPSDPFVRADLLALKKRATQTGAKIILPPTADGRHCDYAPAVVGALSYYLDDPAAVVVELPPGSPEWVAREAAKEEKEDEAEIERQEKREYWEDD